LDLKPAVDKLEVAELKMDAGKMVMRFLSDEEVQELITANENQAEQQQQ
jgi:hypothetical protein